MTKTFDGKQWREYLCGYVAGIETGKSCGDFMIEKRVKHSPMTGGRAVAHSETVVFKTKEQAMAEARKLKASTPDSKIFIRGARYSTPNPENAKGMTIWCKEFAVRHYIENAILSGS